jgi:hypothetical protein
MKLNKQKLVFIFFAAAAGLLRAQSVDSLQQQDTLQAAGRLPILETETWRPDSVRHFNPIVSGTASMVLPGAGQVYTRHYVKAGFFIALEAVFLSMADFWRKNANNRFAREKEWLSLSAADTNLLESAGYREEAFWSRHQALESRFSYYNFLTWAAGGYLFNVLDAWGSSNAFKNTKVKNPGTAGLLAAIPGLGLGQWYNGSISKAGMVMMGQISLGMMAWNSQRLMSRAEDNYRRLNPAMPDSLTRLLSPEYSGSWGDARYRAFTNRNMYLWYSVFFYGYSIFDAVVDAYLHDYPEKMKIKPDLVIGYRQAYLTLQTTF